MQILGCLCLVGNGGMGWLFIMVIDYYGSFPHSLLSLLSTRKNKRNHLKSSFIYIYTYIYTLPTSQLQVEYEAPWDFWDTLFSEPKEAAATPANYESLQASIWNPARVGEFVHLGLQHQTTALTQDVFSAVCWIHSFLREMEPCCLTGQWNTRCFLLFGTQRCFEVFLRITQYTWAQQRLNQHEPTIPIDVWLGSVTLAICFTLPTFLLETDKSWDDTTDAKHLGLSENGSMLDDFPANVQINPVGGQLVGPWVIIQLGCLWLGHHMNQYKSAMKIVQGKVIILVHHPF